MSRRTASTAAVARGFAFAGLLATLGSGCGLVDQLDARRRAREGNAAYASADFATAAAKYEEALRLDAETPNVRLNLAFALYSQYAPGHGAGEIAGRAVDAFDAHLARVPADDKARLFKIKMLLRAAPEEPALAERAYQAFSGMIRQNSADEEARRYLVTLFLATKGYEKALAHYETRLKEHPDDLETMRVLALVAERSRRTQQAVDWYRRRAEAAPADTKPRLYYELATYAWSTLQYEPGRETGCAAIRLADQGIEACRRALDLKPEYGEVMAYANLLYLKRSASEATADGKYFDEHLAYDYRVKAASLLKPAVPAAPQPPGPPPPPDVASTAGAR